MAVAPLSVSRAGSSSVAVAVPSDSKQFWKAGDYERAPDSGGGASLSEVIVHQSITAVLNVQYRCKLKEESSEAAAVVAPELELIGSSVADAAGDESLIFGESNKPLSPIFNMTTVDSVVPENLHVWTNAAFDAAAELAMRPSLRPLQPININSPKKPDPDPCKENRSPSLKKPSPLKPPKKPSDLDAEIVEVETEIARLSAHLQTLRTKKAERVAPRARVVPAKFMEPKTPDVKKIKDSPSIRVSTLKKIEESPAGRRRGASLGPMEIQSFGETPLRKSGISKLEGIQEKKVVRERGLCLSPKPRPSIAKALDKSKKPATQSAMKKVEESPRVRRRGYSLGPMEIQRSVTPLRSVQGRGKWGISKLGGIEEERASKPWERLKKPVSESSATARIMQRGVNLGPSEIARKQEVRGGRAVEEKKSRSSSASPKSQARTMAKFSDLRKGIATDGANKSIQRGEENSKMLIRPKKLFQEVRNSAPSKMPVRGKARVVASRYSLANARVAGSRRKWSLPEPGKEAEQSLSLGECSVNRNSRSLVWIVLPSIRVAVRTKESPRDSGCVKRAADLVGKKAYFDHVALNFDEEEAE